MGFNLPTLLMYKWLFILKTLALVNPPKIVTVTNLFFE